jgi:hypothetical protein
MKVWYLIIISDSNLFQHYTASIPTYMGRVWLLETSSSAEYWRRYLVGWVVGLSSDLGLADLCCVCLTKNTNKNMVKCDRPWRPPLSHGCYGATRPAKKHTTINLYLMRWGCVVKTRKHINYYYIWLLLRVASTTIATTTHRPQNDGHRLAATPLQLIIQQSTNTLCDRFV